MKVILVEPFGHLAGGFPVYARNMSQLLAETEVQGKLITFCGFSDDSNIPIDHYTVISRIGFWAKPVNLFLRFLNFIPLLHPLIYPIQTTITFSYALRQGKKQGCDIVHLLDTSTVSFLFLVFAFLVKNRKLVLTFHGVPREYYFKNWWKDFNTSLKTHDYYRCFTILLARLSSSGLIKVLKKILYNRGTRRNALAFVCHAREERETYAQSIFYDKVTYVPEARPKPLVVTQKEARRYLKLPQEGWIFLCFGINHGHKNYQVIFQAFRGLPKNFKLVFAGKVLNENARSTNPTKLAEENKLAVSTTVINRFITEDEKRYYFCAADALLLSYNRGYSQQSGNLIDACQYGLPVIATDDKQVGEWVRNYGIGLAFTPEDPISLKQVILSFMDLDENERQEMKKRMLNFGNSVRSWEQMKEGYLNLYKSMLGSKK